nr:hypothetical protein [Armatimonadota bacterium]
EGRIILDAEAAGASTGAPSIQFRVPTEDSPFETFYAQLSITGDRGIRFNYNYREPYVGGLSHGRSDQFQILTGMEQDGAWFIRYEKPYTIAAGTYDVGGKSLAIYPGGFTQGVGPSTTQALQTVDIVGMQAGRILRFGASTTAANPIFAMAIGSDGNVQTYNRLGIAASTANGAGIRINAGVDVTAGSAANGDVWCTATDFKCKVGGVVKTFTLT